MQITNEYSNAWLQAYIINQTLFQTTPCALHIVPEQCSICSRTVNGALFTVRLLASCSIECGLAVDKEHHLRHMFNNSDMSDIGFTCEGSDKIFYAHKYVLGTSSAVFNAMFYGGLAVKDSIVHLPDTNEESLEQFLRFLYTEECTLTADNVVAIMYLAQKYIIPLLNEKCVNFLLQNLNPENVLDVLEQATRFDEKELEKQCWKIIESRTGKVVASDSFNNITQTTFAKLLKRDKLKISEVRLFKAVLKWIDFQCSRKNLKPTLENRRSIIGEAIYDFRPLGMSKAEFTKHVSKSGLLTDDELVSISEKFAGFHSPALKWTLPKRKAGNIVSFCRSSRKTKELRDKCGYQVYGGDPDCLFLL